MGLDIAEMMIAFEEVFQVDILEEAAQNIETLDDIVDYIEQEVRKSPTSQTEADRIYAEGVVGLRRFLSEALEIDPPQLEQETELAALLLPLERRRALWKRMREEISDSIPGLYGTLYCQWGWAPAIFLGFLVGLLVVVVAPGPEIVLKVVPGVFCWAFVTLVLYIAGFFVFSPFFSGIPNECATLGGLARCAVRSRVSLDPHGRVWTRESIAEAVQVIVAEQTGLAREKFSLATKFSELS